MLANTGLENLRFLTPLYPGDSMRVELTVKSKCVRDEEKGEVRWAVVRLQPEGRGGRDLRPADDEHALALSRRRGALASRTTVPGRNGASTPLVLLGKFPPSSRGVLSMKIADACPATSRP